MVPRRHRGDRFLRASARRLPTRRQTRLHEPRLNNNQERAAVGKSAALAVTDLLLERPTCWREAPMLSSTMLRAPVRLMATMLVAQLALGSRADGQAIRNPGRADANRQRAARWQGERRAAR